MRETGIKITRRNFVHVNWGNVMADVASGKTVEDTFTWGFDDEDQLPFEMKEPPELWDDDIGGWDSDDEKAQAYIKKVNKANPWRINRR